MRYGLLVLLLLTLACGSTSTLTETYSAGPGKGSAVATDGRGATPGEATVTRIIPPGVTPAGTPIQLTSGDLTLIIYFPADGQVVTEPQVEFVGWTNVETVLTINEEIYILKGQKEFSILVPLEEGPNALEIVASDYAGDELDLVITVTYQPE